MTATDVSVREAGARAWSLIADYRAGRLPDEPGLPLGIALDMVQDTGCERDTAFLALRTAAADALALHGANLPGRIYHNPETWAGCARMVLHLIGAQGVEAALAQLNRAEVYWAQLIERQMGRTALDHQQWRDRADWLRWAEDARLAIRWLRQLAAECAT